MYYRGYSREASNSVKHTRFSIAPAGWFSVSVPTSRSSRLTEHSSHLYLQPKHPRESKTTPPQFTLFQATTAERRGHQLLRAAGITLAAATTMWILLSWLCSYGTWQ
jgi:hypothetical protein